MFNPWLAFMLDHGVTLCLVLRLDMSQGHLYLSDLGLEALL